MEIKEQEPVIASEKSREKRPRLRPVATLRLVILGAALCAVVGLACFFAGRAGGAAIQENVQLDAVVLETRLNEISELASVSWSYTNMAQFESSNEFYGMTLPFTTKKFILTYDGEIKAGVDLQKAAVSISGTAVTVRLPASAILSHEIDAGSVEVFDEKTSIFNPFTVEDFTAFQADQKTAMEEKAVAKGLLTEAAQQVEHSVRLLLEAALPVGYTLNLTSAPQGA